MTAGCRSFVAIQFVSPSLSPSPLFVVDAAMIRGWVWFRSVVTPDPSPRSEYAAASSLSRVIYCLCSSCMLLPL